MRKITKESIKAFYNREPFKKSNMIVENIKGVTKLKLHNNTIAKLDENSEMYSFGYDIPSEDFYDKSIENYIERVCKTRRGKNQKTEFEKIIRDTYEMYYNYYFKFLTNKHIENGATNP
mgnify:FL=1